MEFELITYARKGLEQLKEAEAKESREQEQEEEQTPEPEEPRTGGACPCCGQSDPTIKRGGGAMRG